MIHYTWYFVRLPELMGCARKELLMKKILIALLLALALVLSVVLVACGDTPDESTGELETVTPHPDESGSEGTDSETEVETDGALGVVEDTEEGWGEVHK